MFAMTNTRPSTAQEDYIRAISKLYNGIDPVGVTELAVALGVRAPSVSGMIHRLESDGLLEHRARVGVLLTARGQVLALEIHRRHRLVETFLVQALGFDWAEVHEEAEALEHHLSERVVQAIDRYLGHPTTDPHGHPIPAADGTVIVRQLCLFDSLRPGDRAVIREVGSEDPERIRRWTSLGLVPGARVQILGSEELDGIWKVEVEGRKIVTGRPGVQGLKVERLAD